MSKHKLRAMDKFTKHMRLAAKINEENNDGLTLKQQVYDCCDEIDRLVSIMRTAYATWLEYGPVDDGEQAGHAFEEALTKLGGH